jgi:hypothetical protein
MQLLVAVAVLMAVGPRGMDGLFAHQRIQRRLACSVGDSPTGGTVRAPVAGVAFAEETNRRKPTDQAILGMVSESPGRNGSEPRSSLEENAVWRLSPLLRGEGRMAGARLTDAAGHVAGVGGCVKKTRRRQAVREMKGGPSKSACRSRLQTARRCCGQTPWW